MEQRKTVVRIEENMQSSTFHFHTHFRSVPILMAQGFFSFFVVQFLYYILFHVVHAFRKKTKHPNKNKHCNYSIEVDDDDDDYVHTKLDNRNAIRMQNNKANTKMTLERK